MTITIAAPAGFFQNDPVNPQSVTDLVSAVTAAQAAVADVETQVTAAAASATAASAAASDATAAASTAVSTIDSAVTAATTSINDTVTSAETTINTAATGAATSATNAATSETNAAASATTATSSATSASTSATAAASSATAAASSATAASGSASAANTSATNAASSATAAAASATTASTGASTATTQAGNASTSATAAATSATNAAASATLAATMVGNAIGKNKFHNGLFNIAQRGTGPFTTTGAYTLDRWQMTLTTDTMSVTQVALNDTDRSQIGDEEAEFGLQNVFTSAGGSTSLNVVLQKVEDARRLSGKTVTVSFFAKAASGTPKLAVSAVQSFGTGGSPSSAVSVPGSFVTLSTTWARYQVAIALPSTSGKTFGSNGDSCTVVDFYFSAGSSVTQGVSMGTQSGTITLWGTQLEVAAAATALEKPDIRYDKANCQRFYLTTQGVIGGYGVTGAGVGQSVAFPVTMRATPTAASISTTNSNVSSFTLTPLAGGVGVWLNGVVTATGAWSVNSSFSATADL